MSKHSKVIKINGSKTNYIITDCGFVYSLNYKNTGKKHKIKSRIDKDGYIIVTIYLNGKRYDRKVHRLVAEAFIKNPENKKEVNHINGVKTDNHKSNLEWATNLENVRHSWKMGLATGKSGENNAASKNSNADIRKVCQLIEENKNTFKEIHKITGVEKSIIKAVFHKQIWTFISKDYDFTKFVKFECKRISNDTAHVICKMISSGKLTLREISKKTGVSYRVVYRIYSGESHKKISAKYNFDNYKMKG